MKQKKLVEKAMELIRDTLDRPDLPEIDMELFKGKYRLCAIDGSDIALDNAPAINFPAASGGVLWGYEGTNAPRGGELDPKRLKEEFGSSGRAKNATTAMASIAYDPLNNWILKRISGYLENWDSIGFEDRRLVADGLISTIRATSESVQIE